MSRRYPKEVHDFIRANVEGRTTKELAELVNAAFGLDFTPASMKSYKANHHLKSGTPSGTPKDAPSALFPAPVADFIRQHHQGVGNEDLTDMVNQEFGAAYTVAQIRSYRKNHKLPSGVDCKFQKGHVSPNKGKKGVCAPGSEKGWFQKGHDPHNTVPVGTILTKSDGYLWKKIDDKPGIWRQNWRQLHILTWEEHNGPLPEGYRLIFKDGDRTNCSIENLAMVTLAENAVLTNCHLRFDDPEFTETGILIAKIQIAAGKRKKQED